MVKTKVWEDASGEKNNVQNKCFYIPQRFEFSLSTDSSTLPLDSKSRVVLKYGWERALNWKVGGRREKKLK